MHAATSATAEGTPRGAPAPAERLDVAFDSGGVTCAADLYRPPGASAPVPCVVMAHGTAGTRDLGLAAYAERFAAAGFAVLLFDYRHFGASGGRPRQLIDVVGQQDDYRAAVRFARARPGIDPARIALWGTSLSGGHVMVVAAGDPGIAAVVSQVPFAGVEYGRRSPRSAGATLRLLAAAARDALHGLVGLPPHLIPLVGEPGSAAAFTDPDARTAVAALAAGAPAWRNAFAARAILTLMRYRPGEVADRVAAPMLVCMAERDTAGSVALAVRAAERAPRGELRRYPLDHFAVYSGAAMEQLVADQTAFLRAHLLGDPQGGAFRGTACPRQAELPPATDTGVGRTRLDRIETAARAAAAVGAAGLTAMALLGLGSGLRRPKGRVVGRPYGRLPLALVATLGLVYGVLAVRLWRPLPPRLPINARVGVLASGAVLYWAGLGLVLWGRLALGDMYNVSSAAGAELYEHHRLVTGGPFRFVRHPMYLGAVLWAAGALLLYRTWTLVLVVAHMAVFSVRARREEEALAAEFGDAWRAYARRVPAGIPVFGPRGATRA
jgi:protein-S-isoprenylcysteine O-methyltransferase Ste14/fermentation-respiration switch protein FrsA (DUF1100 family)